MSAPYARRQLNVTFQLGKGSFGASGFDTVTFKAPSTGAPGMRIFTEISFAQLPSQVRGIIRIYGLTLDHINQLTKAGRFYDTRNDKVMVQAGDVGGALTTVFVGNIKEAYPDFREMPNTAFQVIAFGGGEINLKPVEPTSFEGSVSTETALKQIVQKCGLTLENNGVNTMLSNPYFPGTGITQINRAIMAANCFGAIDTISNKLAIWPKGSSRSGGQAAQIGPNTGMIGYPEFEQIFIRVRSLFDPAAYAGGPGGRINVDTQLTAAKGEWTIHQVDLTLASEMPDGPWEMLIKGGRSDQGTTAPT